MSANGFYWSAHPDSTIETPQIGDVRIHFAATYATDVSVMAQQSGDSFQPLETHSGRKLNMLSLGLVSANEMIEKAESENSMFTWSLRVLGSILMIFGIGFVLRPLSTMTERIPIIGNLVGMGTAVVAMLLGGALSLFAIGIAWLFYRPLVAIPLIAIGVGLLWLLIRKSGKPDAIGAETPPPTVQRD